jgi:hypothetical protein
LSEAIVGLSSMFDFSSDLKTGVSFDESLPFSFAEGD